MGYFEKGKWIDETTSSPFQNAPFQEGQVDSINAYQCARYMHPLTCGNCGGVLVASTHGLDCYDCGRWFQTWVPNFTANWEWQKKRRTDEGR